MSKKNVNTRAGLKPADPKPRSAACNAHKAAWDERQVRKAALRESNARARAERSPREQIKLLNARLGPGEGAVKERKRLWAQIEAELVASQASNDNAKKPVKSRKK